MFGPSLPPVVCRRAHILITLFVLVAHSGVQHIFCCVFDSFVLVLCTLCWHFLWIVHSWLLLRNSLTFFYNEYRFLNIDSIERLRSNAWGFTKIVAYWQWGMEAPKPIQLTLISAYWECKMAAPKPIWLSQDPAYVQGRMNEPKLDRIDYPRFLHMYKEEWMSPNINDYPWFLHMGKEEWRRQTHMFIPDFWIWTRKNGLDQTRMIIPDFCTWIRKNGLDQTRIIIPDFFIWTRKKS